MCEGYILEYGLLADGYTTEEKASPTPCKPYIPQGEVGTGEFLHSCYHLYRSQDRAPPADKMAQARTGSVSVTTTAVRSRVHV